MEAQDSFVLEILRSVITISFILEVLHSAITIGKLDLDTKVIPEKDLNIIPERKNL